VSSTAWWSIAMAIARRTRTSLVGPEALFMARVTSPLVVPSITWKRLSPSNWASASGACTVPMTSMPSVRSALTAAVASRKYCRWTWRIAGGSPQ
jgi:hypothetical protein